MIHVIWDSECDNWVNNKVAASKALSMLTLKFLSTRDLKVLCVKSPMCEQHQLSPNNITI